jgi:hypothetical protein
LLPLVAVVAKERIKTMSNAIVTNQYSLPQSAGSFKLSLPSASVDIRPVCLGVFTLNGTAHLLVQEPLSFTARQDWNFSLVETGCSIPGDGHNRGCEYLGSFECEGTGLHLYGQRTQRSSIIRC